MPVDQSLYEALGVDPSASQDSVKQAWRDLARDLHPDRNPDDPVAAARFRAVRAAWEILGDPKRRALYDEFGEDATSAFFDPEMARAAKGPSSTGTLWSEDARTPTRKVYKVQRGDDYRASLHLDRDEARKGGMFGLYVRAPAVCKACEGTGWRKSMRACSKCEGGKIPGIGPFGLPIPAGVVNGQQFVSPGDGAKGRGQGAPPGDLWVTVRVPPTYVSQGRDQLLVVPVPQSLLVTGGKVRVPLPGAEGKAIRMTIPEGSGLGRKMRVPGKAEGGGDLYVRLEKLPPPTTVHATKVALG